MKILILAQSRSGSTSLVKAIYDKTKMPFLYEPFKPMNKNKHDDQAKIIKESSDLLVKIVDNNFMFYDKFKDYKELTKHFDKVIGLTRTNDNDNAKSKLVAEITDDWRSSSSQHYIEESMFSTDRYLNILQDSKRYRAMILSYDIFQITYEGIYINKNEINKLEDYLGFTIKEFLYLDNN